MADAEATAAAWTLRMFLQKPLSLMSGGVSYPNPEIRTLLWSDDPYYGPMTVTGSSL